MPPVVVSSGAVDMEIARGEGCVLTDMDGRRFLDFCAGWCVGNIGWGNASVAAAIREAASRGVYVMPSWANAPAEEFGELLLSIVPGTILQHVLRCTSGSEAVEMALQYARASTGRNAVLSIENAYHGHTYGAASLGDALTDSIGPGVSGIEKLPMPRDTMQAEEVLSRLERRLQAGDVAAFFTEPVWTSPGAIVPPPSFLPRVQELCREHGALFCMDEVATGFGRCGVLFGSELWDLDPDIMTLGKGLTGGYATMGAVLVSKPVAEASEKVPSYSTFGWVPMDLAAARANVQVILDGFLWENAASVGAVLLEELIPLSLRKDVGEVRGIGLVLGIDVVDSASGRPDVRGAEAIVDECRRRGLLLESTGHTLFLSPPLTLTRAQALQGASVLRTVFDER